MVFKKIFRALRVNNVSFYFTSEENLYSTTAPVVHSTSASTENISYIDWSSLSREDCKLNNGVLVGTGCSTPIYKPDVFFFCCLLFIFTFVLSMGLKTFRNTRYLTNKVILIFRRENKLAFSWHILIALYFICEKYDQTQCWLNVWSTLQTDRLCLVK